MRAKRKRRFSLQQQQSLYGHVFTLPLVIGFVFFFAYPFIQSVIFSLSQLVMSPTGFELEYVGLENYREALFVHPRYVRVLVETVMRVVSNVPLILAFSFFAALLLNQNFKGRSLARVIFFLPVIYGAGVILKMESTDYVTMLLAQGGSASTEVVRISSMLRDFLMQMRLPAGLLAYIMGAIDQVPSIIRASGIQTLVFLAGLQSISPQLYEVADVEGGTKWEIFWLITLPLISPLILLNIVYSIVDSFTSGTNEMIGLTKEVAFASSAGYGISAAMSWMYFLIIGLILAVSIGLVSRKVFYQE